MERYCGCEDFYCCGHGCSDADPEDAQEWLDGMDEEEREFAMAHMSPCASCGEMRPNDDPAMVVDGCCHMCHQDPERARSSTAYRNLCYFGSMLSDRDTRLADQEDRIAELERTVLMLRLSNG